MKTVTLCCRHEHERCGDEALSATSILTVFGAVPVVDQLRRQGRIELLPCGFKLGLGRLQTFGVAPAPGRNREGWVDVPRPNDTLPRPLARKHDPADDPAFMEDAIVVLELLTSEDSGAE
jgi:hypothetical protein